MLQCAAAGGWARAWEEAPGQRARRLQPQLAPSLCPNHTLRSDAIYSARYDGSGHMEVLRGHEFLSHPFAVTLYGGEVYWTDWRTNTLAKANKWTGHNVTVVQRTNTQPFDLQVYHPSRQPMGKEPAASPGALTRGGGDENQSGSLLEWRGGGGDPLTERGWQQVRLEERMRRAEDW